MRRLYVTSLQRVEAGTQETATEAGRIDVIDWDSGQLLRNPLWISGSKSQGSRSLGCRGAAWYQDQLVVADHQNSLYYIDPDRWRIVDRVILEGAGALHQIKEHSGLLHVCSTATDELWRIAGREVVEKVDLTVNYKTFANLEPLSSFAEHTPGKDALHFNSISWNPHTNHELHVYMGRNLIFDWTAQEVVVHIPELFDSLHDLEHLDQNRLIFNNSLDCSTLIYDQISEQIRTLFRPLPGPELERAPVSKLGFSRGLAVVQNLVFSAYSPGTVYAFRFGDNGTFWVEGRPFILHLDTTYSVYSLVPDPRDWS